MPRLSTELLGIRMLRLRGAATKSLAGARAAVAIVAAAGFVMTASPTARGSDAVGIATAEVVRAQYFEALRHNVVDVVGTFVDGAEFRADFLGNYRETGGVERWGYPTSAVVEERTGTLTQYYQRGVIDWQPPPGGGAPTFQRRLAWDYLGGGLGGAPDMGVEGHLTNPNPGEVVGPWGHKVANRSVEGVEVGFADFFHRLGGVASFGFPKTEARRDDHLEANLLIPGRPPDSRIRQYYQAAVLEYHPESPGAPVKLRLLGDTLRDRRYPGRAWEQYLAFGPEEPLAAGDRLELGLASRRGPHGATAGDVARFLELSLLRVTTDRACGTGFVVTASGYAVTTWRLVMDAAEIGVESPRGYTAPAHLVAGDVERDLALIKVAGEGHIPVQWGEAEDLAQTTELVAIGYEAASLQTGRGVDCHSRVWATSILDWSMQPDQRRTFAPAINAGNSGGPVATTSGRVVGMVASGSADRPWASTFAAAAEIQPLIASWIAGLEHGQPPAVPTPQPAERIVMFERVSVACPRDRISRGLLGNRVVASVQGSEIELSMNVWLNAESHGGSLIGFGSVYDHLDHTTDLISFGRFIENGSRYTLQWVRIGRRDESTDTRAENVLKHEVHPDIDVGARYNLRFVYGNGSVALFINGVVVYQEADILYGSDISLSIGCTGSIQSPDIFYYDVRIVGRPL